MLIDFTVGNYRSFMEPVTLSMVTSKTKSYDPRIDENNSFIVFKDLSLLKSTAIYGANASGKSNLVHAIAFMRKFVLNSSRESQAEEPIGISPFLLNTEFEIRPSFFQVIFLVDGVRYRYGFEVLKDKVTTEWLFYVPSTKEARLFVRDENGIQVSRAFKEGNGLEKKTRPNALFLSVVTQFNGEIATKVTQWFRRLGIISGLDDKAYKGFTLKKFSSGQLRDPILSIVKAFDLGIVDLIPREDDPVTLTEKELKFFSEEAQNLLLNLLKEKNQYAIKTIHTKWDADGKPFAVEEFNIEQESEGTQKLFFLSGPIIDALQNGRVLIIDEMEARLHPLITQRIISLFNSNETNLENAQLIFTTHDTNLLSNRLFRRDQIWFIERDEQSASHLYSLVELKVRSNSSFEDDYIQGRYGAIPYLGGIERINIILKSD